MPWRLLRSLELDPRSDQDTGRGAAFSIILNDVPSSVARSWVKQFEEGVVKGIDAYLRTGDAGIALGQR